MKHGLYIIGVALLLLTSCERQQAKSTIRDFVEAHIDSDADLLEFSVLDSTHVISDSLLDAMRSQNTADYATRKDSKLLFMRVRYLSGVDTCSATFYLNPDLEDVVAYKKN
ncbi:MAG: hypothetical protein ILA25_03695 [Prevotella sp.]|nr:hypothetical protein [Prevotella sp.]